MLIYHATYGEYLRKILEEGIVPDKHENWMGAETRGLVFFSDDPDAALSFCECADAIYDDTYDSGIFIIAIESDMLDKDLFEADPNLIGDAGPGIAYRGEVPTSAFVNADALRSQLARHRRR